MPTRVYRLGMDSVSPMDESQVKAFNDTKAARKWFTCPVCRGVFPSKEDRNAHGREVHRWN